MLKKRLIPKLLIRHQQIGAKSRPILVTTKFFQESINVGNPVSQAKIYEAQMADELIVLNIDGTDIGQDDIMLDLVRRLASETFMPLTVGGGVKTLEDFGALLACGADKVAINTAALDDPTLISRAAERYGAQCVVVSIDFRTRDDGRTQVFNNRGQRVTDLDVVAWAEEAVERGAGEILLCDADRDGTGTGLNCNQAFRVASRVSVPLILSGGCGLADHFVRGFLEGNAEAVAAGTFFCFRDQSLMQTRAHIRNAGVPIRMET